MDGERYAFVVEWYDSPAELLRDYVLFFFTIDGTIELFDVKRKKTFLNRCSYPDVTIKELFMGSVLTIYSRRMTIKEFADEFTRQSITDKYSSTVVLIPLENEYTHKSMIGFGLHTIVQSGLAITNIRMLELSTNELTNIYGNETEDIKGGIFVASEVRGENSMEKVKSLGDKRDSEHKRLFLVPASRDLSPDFVQSFFGSQSSNPPLGTPTAKMRDCTLVLILPHTLKEDVTYPQIISTIEDANFRISAMQLLSLDPTQAGEFFAAYESVIGHYKDMITAVCSGPLIALEVTIFKSELNIDMNGIQEESGPVVNRMREVAGPSDPAIAKRLRPDTIRALYGTNIVMNAVHVTDLPEDGIIEVEHFFSLIDTPSNVNFRENRVSKK